MPSIDPTTGKPLSGAQKRARAAAAKAAQYAERAAAKPEPALSAAAAAGPAAPSFEQLAAGSRLSGTHEDFARLPPAPLDDPAAAIAWVNSAALIGLQQVLQDPKLTPPERWGWLERFGRMLGMIRDKASEQALMKAWKAAQTEKAQTQGTVSAGNRSKTPLPRPS